MIMSQIARFKNIHKAKIKDRIYTVFKRLSNNSDIPDDITLGMKNIVDNQAILKAVLENRAETNRLVSLVIGENGLINLINDLVIRARSIQDQRREHFKKIIAIAVWCLILVTFSFFSNIILVAYIIHFQIGF